MTTNPQQSQQPAVPGNTSYGWVLVLAAGIVAAVGALVWWSSTAPTGLEKVQCDVFDRCAKQATTGPIVLGIVGGVLFISGVILAAGRRG